MSKLFKMAWRNIWRNWRRTTIALIAIVIGLTLLVFADGLYGNIDQVAYGNAVRLFGGNLQVHAPGFRGEATPPPLPVEDADQVAETVTVHRRCRRPRNASTRRHGQRAWWNFPYISPPSSPRSKSWSA